MMIAAGFSVEKMKVKVLGHSLLVAQVKVPTRYSTSAQNMAELCTLCLVIKKIILNSWYVVKTYSHYRVKIVSRPN